MKRILITVLAMLLFFLLFASNYSAVGGNGPLVAIGFWGFLLSPVVFCIVVLTDCFRK